MHMKHQNEEKTNQRLQNIRVQQKCPHLAQTHALSLARHSSIALFRYTCAKIIEKGLSFTKLLQKIKWCSFLGLWGTHLYGMLYICCIHSQ